MKRQLFKTKLTLWTEKSPHSLSLEVQELLSRITNSRSFCSEQDVEKVVDLESDEDFTEEVEEFFFEELDKGDLDVVSPAFIKDEQDLMDFPHESLDFDDLDDDEDDDDYQDLEDEELDNGLEDE